MDLRCPDWWNRFDRQSISLDAVNGTPGIRHDAAAAFGESALDGVADRHDSVAAMAAGAAADAAGHGLFLRVARHGSDPRAATKESRTTFRALGIAPPASTDDRALRTVGGTTSATGRHVVFQQRIGGADVVGASFKVHVGDDEMLLTGRPIGDVPDRRPVSAPKADATEATGAAATAFDLDPRTVREVLRQVFPEAGGGGRWVYRVSFVDTERYADVRAYLDADSLDVLLSFNIAAALRGTARIYPVSPGRTPTLEQVNLADLGPVPADQLAGRRLVVRPAATPPLVSPTRSFVLDPTVPGFDEPNAYYHLRRALRWFGLLAAGRRLSSPPFRPVRAFVRDPSSPGNAFYGPTLGELRFGDFGDRPSARSADLIYHELAHAVSDTAARLSRGVRNSEARGMSEGYSDYFASTLLDDPRIGDWLAPMQVRDASDAALRFPVGFVGEEHATGAVYAAMLWSLRQRLGAPTMDRIAFESLFFLSPTSGFLEGRAALLAADRLLAGGGAPVGPHAGAIEEAWAARN